MNYFLQNKIGKIIESNVKEIPWEGKKVNEYEMQQGIEELFTGVMKGLISYAFKNFELTVGGYRDRDSGIVKSREEILTDFLNQMK